MTVLDHWASLLAQNQTKKTKALNVPFLDTRVQKTDGQHG